MKLKIKRIATLALILLLLTPTLSAKIERRDIYIFGFAASFLDSVVYITDIQLMDSAYVEKKSKFLMDRAVYSDQLQSFIEEEGGFQNYTCAVIYELKKKDIDELYEKIKKRYIANENLIVKQITLNDFQFQFIDYVTPVTPIEQPKANKSDERPEPPSDGRGNPPGGGGGTPPNGGGGFGF